MMKSWIRYWLVLVMVFVHSMMLVADAVTPKAASATPIATQGESSGLVKETVPRPASGAYTPEEEKITGTPGTNISPEEAVGSAISPVTITGGPIEVSVQPQVGPESYGIQVVSSDADGPLPSGNWPAYLRVDLVVRFPAVAGHAYTVTWNNWQMEVKWDGLISLAKGESSGVAKFKAWTREPAALADETSLAEADNVLVPINPPTNEWSHAPAGPILLPITEETDTLNINLSRDFDFTPAADQIDAAGFTSHQCFTLLRVRLDHTVAAGSAEDPPKSRYSSATTSWVVSNWRIGVLIEE